MVCFLFSRDTRLSNSAKSTPSALKITQRKNTVSKVPHSHLFVFAMQVTVGLWFADDATQQDKVAGLVHACVLREQCADATSTQR